MITAKDSFITRTPMFTIDYKSSTISFKLEQHSPMGSIKARTAFFIIKNILDNNPNVSSLKLCESTSGNLGLALNQLALNEGIEFLCLIDETISKEKLHKLNSHNVKYEIVEVMGTLNNREARICRAKELTETGYIWTNQYDSEAAIQAHYETTGPEIFQQTNGKVTHAICAMGTGGTIVGVGKYLHEQDPHIQIIGVEPWGSTIFSNYDGNYLCAGAGMRGVPGNIKNNPLIIDMHFAVKDEDSIKACNYLKKNYNLNVGITSGMAFKIADIIASNNPNSHIVVICPDGRDSYEEFFKTI